jgi:hypothetical protein
MSPLVNAGEFEQGGAALNKDTSLLAKDHGWLDSNWQILLPTHPRPITTQ